MKRISWFSWEVSLLKSNLRIDEIVEVAGRKYRYRVESPRAGVAERVLIPVETVQAGGVK